MRIDCEILSDNNADTDTMHEKSVDTLVISAKSANIPIPDGAFFSFGPLCAPKLFFDDIDLLSIPYLSSFEYLRELQSWPRVFELVQALGDGDQGIHGAYMSFTFLRQPLPLHFLAHHYVKLLRVTVQRT